MPAWTNLIWKVIYFFFLKKHNATYCCESLGNGRPNATTGKKGVITIVSTGRNTNKNKKLKSFESILKHSVSVAELHFIHVLEIKVMQMYHLQCRDRRTRALAQSQGRLSSCSCAAANAETCAALWFAGCPTWKHRRLIKKWQEEWREMTEWVQSVLH